jgi:hypothetical protein
MCNEFDLVLLPALGRNILHKIVAKQAARHGQERMTAASACAGRGLVCTRRRRYPRPVATRADANQVSVRRLAPATAATNV